MKFKLSPLFLLLALICFALPFVEVSCENENPTPKASEAKTTLSDSLNNNPADTTIAKTGTADSVQAKPKPAPKPATPTPPEIVKLYTYTGLNMVLGTEPRNHLLDSAPPKTEAKPEAAKPAKPARDSISKDESAALKSDTVQTATPQKTKDAPAKEDKGPKNTKNIYALLAFVLILIAMLLSLLRAPILAVIVALLSFVATIMLYMLKLYFPGYFLAYSQLDAQALQILTIKFSPWYWVAFVLPLLAMVDSMWRFARTNPKAQEEILEPVALEPMPDYDEAGNLIELVEPVDPVEPIEAEDLPTENEQEKL